MIIVNDSPTDNSYNDFASSINDARIHYHINNINRGVNFTRNFGLHKLSADSKWVIFLDDDDYLAPDALQTFHDLILLHPDQKWFVTNRAYKNGKLLTHIKKPNTNYSYIFDYLILKKCKGDVTHCISTPSVHSISFSRRIAQGEEWFFFYQLGLKEKMFYHDHNSTITDGYDTISGLNFRKRSREEKLETLTILFYEGVSKNLIYHPTFLIYLFIRLTRVIVFK
jgi:glycosyltransferase involved in cell wall biosynthesis